MGGYHSSRWYANHPEARKPDQKSKPDAEIQTVSNTFLAARRFTGIGFFLGGFKLMDSHFWFGFVLGNIGFLLIILEICYEPELLKRFLPLQVVLLGACFGLWAVFIIETTNTDAPLTTLCYEMQKGSYPDGTVLGGISWDSHFTDLRVTLTNPTDDEYQKVDFVIKPEGWTYKAGFMTEVKGCELTSEGGGRGLVAAQNVKAGTKSITATKLGHTFDFHDNEGNVYTTVAMDGGYRLRCTTIPAHMTMQIIFACVNPGNTNANFPKDAFKNAKPGAWGFTAYDHPPMPSVFDLLQYKPDVKTVELEGSLLRERQPFHRKLNVSVGQGN